jgi:hypothetical protein
MKGPAISISRATNRGSTRSNRTGSVIEFQTVYALVSLNAPSQCSPKGTSGFPASAPMISAKSERAGSQDSPTPTIETSPALPFWRKSEYLTLDNAAQMYSSNLARKSSSLPRNLLVSQVRTGASSITTYVVRSPSGCWISYARI